MIATASCSGDDDDDDDYGALPILLFFSSSPLLLSDARKANYLSRLPKGFGCLNLKKGLILKNYKWSLEVCHFFLNAFEIVIPVSDNFSRNGPNLGTK